MQHPKRKFSLVLSTLLVIVAGAIVLYNPTDILAAFTKNKNSLNSGLVGYWTFDGKDTNWSTGRVTDMTGNGDTGTVRGMSTSTTPVIGKLGQAFYFDGSDDSVDLVGSMTSLALPLTVSFWIKPQSTADYYSVIETNKVGTAAHSGVWVEVDALGTLSLHYGDDTSCSAGGRRSGYTAASVITLNEWQHVVGIINTATDMVVFINGVNSDVVFYDGGGGALTNNTGTTGAIGYDYNCAGVPAYFNGALDDVRVYNRALTAADVAQLYKMGSAKFGVSPTQNALSLNRGLLGYWTFDAKHVNWATGRLTDMSGSGNHGALQSMSTSTTPGLGKVGQGFLYDGVNDYVRVPAGTLNGLSVFTVCAWVKPIYSTAIAYPNIFSTYDAGSTGGWDLYLIDSSGNYGFGTSYRGSGGYGTVEYFPAVVKSGEWSFLCAEQNGDLGTNMSLYFNGASTTPSNTVSNTRQSDTGFGANIGWAQEGFYPFKGNIDEVRVYNRNLSEVEIAELYKLGQPKFAASPTNNTNPLYRGLVGYWTLDGKDINWGTGRITDRSPNSYTGTIQGMGTRTSPVIGKLGQALYFDGNNYVDAGDVTNLNMGTNDWTVAYWYKSTSTSLVFADVVAKGDYLCGGLSGWGAELSATGRIRGVFGGPALCRVAPVDDGTVVMDGTWHHISVVFNRSSNMLRYADGQLTGTAYDISGLNGVNITTSMPACIGARCPGGASEFTTGTLDDVRVYNRALTATEILQLYQMGQSRAQ